MDSEICNVPGLIVGVPVSFALVYFWFWCLGTAKKRLATLSFVVSGPREWALLWFVSLASIIGATRGIRLMFLLNFDILMSCLLPAFAAEAMLPRRASWCFCCRR